MITALNTVDNTKMVNPMELLKKSDLKGILSGECSKTMNKLDIIHISTRMEAHTLASSYMDRKRVMAYSDGLMEEHIMGSTI